MGRVRRIAPGHGTRAGRICTQSVGSYGYASVGLSKKGVSRTSKTHILVARAFLGEPPVGEEVNHKDSNRMNPILSNLEYVTRSGNVRHCINAGRFNVLRGEQKTHKLTEVNVRQILLSKETDRVLASNFGVSHRTIWAIRNRKKWKHVILSREEIKEA